MKDYLPYIKKSAKGNTTYEDVVNGVIKELGEVSDDERAAIEDDVVNYFHVSDNDARAMWGSDEDFLDIEAAVEKNMVKEAQPVLPQQETSFELDPVEMNRLFEEFSQMKLKKNVNQDQAGALKEFLESKGKSIYYKLMLAELQQRQQAVGEPPQKIEKPKQNKKASAILDELSEELKADGEDDAADAVKDLL